MTALTRRSVCRTAVICAGAVLTGQVLAAQRATAPSLDQLLKRTAEYLAQYETEFSAVVSEEQYRQDNNGATTSQSRKLKSDLLLVSAGEYGWIGLRDVFEVDGKPVRDHEDRLLKLATEVSPDAAEQARRIADESARFNIGRITRTINYPTVALLFLRAGAQERSTFSMGGQRTIDGIRTQELKFVEHRMPRMITSLDNAPVSGSFWINPANGCVLRTEIEFNSSGTFAHVAIQYKEQKALELWVPVQMDEEYRLPFGGSGVSIVPGANRYSTLTQTATTITGRATYSNFRKFGVETSTLLKNGIIKKT